MILHLHRKKPDGEALRGLLEADGGIRTPSLERTSVAIPKGMYRVRMTFSPKFQKQLPLLEDVPRRTGIRIHRGTRPEHSEGCILVPDAAAMKELIVGISHDQAAGIASYIFIDEPDPTAHGYDMATIRGCHEQTYRLVAQREDRYGEEAQV